MDIKIAFLNGELEEKIYMTQPNGFIVKGQEDKVYEKFDLTLVSVGFSANEVDRYVYYCHGGGQGVILCLCVDDILIFGTSIDVINEVKTFFYQSFNMKDLGEADVILNIKLIKGENRITLTQSHYVEKVLSRFGYKDSKPSSTPYHPSLIL
jgi:hypothetical protein